MTKTNAVFSEKIMTDSTFLWFVFSKGQATIPVNQQRTFLQLSFSSVLSSCGAALLCEGPNPIPHIL